MRARITTAAFVRSHGRAPRGRGSWGFQLSSGETAYDSELSGDEWWSSGSTPYALARRDALAHFGAGQLVAVLP